jgi:squalene-associated FAD-dependent desaturase
VAESRSTDTCDVVVIGAGCAGLSAAVRLAARGKRVTVIEEAPRFGGRATAFADPESGRRLDNGQHALFGCYRETYEFLRAIGTADQAPLDSTLTLVMAGPGRERSTLRCPDWRPPFHLIAGLWSFDALPLMDRLAAARMAGLLWRVRRDGAAHAAAQVPSQLSVNAWLHQQGQPASLCDWLWRPLAWAALNQDPDVAAARPFVRVIGELFGPSPGASSIAVPSVPLDELYAEPAARFVETHGGAVLRRTTARVELDPSGHHHRVFAGEQAMTCRAVISAVPWHAFGRLWNGAAPERLAATADNAGRMSSVPIVTAYLWFDRPLMTERQIGLIGTEFHWVFNKDIGRPHLYSLVASGAEGLLRSGNEELAALAERELRACVSGVADAVCLRSLVVREARATFSLAPGAPPRPATVTTVAGFYLAGDWTDTGLPGTIESGVLSGHRAADAAMIML